MKLLQKNNLYYFIFSFIAVIAIGASFYIVTEYLIYDEVESRLRVEKRDFQDYISRNKGVWYNSCYFVENKIDLIPASKEHINNIEVFADTLMYDKYTDKKIRFRQVSFYEKLGDEYYQVHLRKSLLESDKLLKYLTATILLLLAIAFSIIYVMQRRISKSIWHSFYDTLSKIKLFDISKEQGLNLLSTKIYEFKELNQVLEKMAAKMKQDYHSLKEFTENASHEIQTPLALINARIEELIQSKHLSEKEIHLINEIHTSSSRVSKLANALLLLSKIENGQFPDFETISFDKLLKNKVEEFEEIFRHHELTVKYNCSGDFVVNMNSALADILLTNLIGNAVKHNYKKGQINILLSEDRFEISNTGQSLTVDPSSLFGRFKKGKHRSDSSGLGLAIVSQICHNYKLEVTYTFQKDWHIIQILKTTA